MCAKGLEIVVVEPINITLVARKMGMLFKWIVLSKGRYVASKYRARVGRNKVAGGALEY